jgi:hypothetical protein
MQLPDAFVLDGPHPLVVALREDLVLLLLDEDFVLEVADDGLQLDLTIIHWLSIIADLD